MVRLSGWGGFPFSETKVETPLGDEEFRALVNRGKLIARGNGRAYGDSAVGLANTLLTKRLNKMIFFDERTGVLVVEAGVMLEDIINIFLPRGWFPLVTPGTKYVTIGGMIAADVHGKNHHIDGSMASCVHWLELMDSAGAIQQCSLSNQKELFDHTIGGMGLTGIINKASIQLRPVETGWISQTTHACSNFRDTMERFEESDSSTYSVAWIDCLSRRGSLGRSLIMLGEHTPLDELGLQHKSNRYAVSNKKKISVPFHAPGKLLNGLTVRVFNSIYYQKGRLSAGRDLVTWDAFFYPLDNVLGWNRIYGRRGFIQFQCVLPLAASDAGLDALLRAISEARAGSFLAVLKRLGPGRLGGLSFPMEGYTLALDFPVNEKNIGLVSRLHAITSDHGGRVYLAKDSVMTSEIQRKTDIRTQDFLSYRQKINASSCFVSRQSRRLEL